MTITLDINPEVQAALERQAAAQGRPIEAVAAILLEEAVHLPVAMHRSSIERTLCDLARFSAKVPDLPDEALTREALYPDHR